MNTYTDTQIRALVAAGIDLNEFFALDTAPTQAPVAKPAKAKKAKASAPTQEKLPTLTRARWNALRTTKGGTVKKAFVGLTREQAHAKGLTPGYDLPTGAMRAALRG